MRTALISALVALLFFVGCKKETPPTPAPVAPPPVVKEAPPPPPPPVEKVAVNFTRVHFAYDSAALSSSTKSALSDNARILKDHGDVRVEIQGHCDERGTTDYNMALGNQRAAAVRGYLVNAGVSPNRITVISYGEEKPSSHGGNETAWSKNRRAEFRITAGNDGSVHDTVGTASGGGRGGRGR